VTNSTTLLFFPVQITCLSLEHWIPLVADFALIFKLLSFYPPRLYTRRARLIRLSPPTLLLLPRLVFVSYLTYLACVIYHQPVLQKGRLSQLVSLEATDRFVLVSTLDFATQAAFCLFASCALFYKTIHFYRNLQQIRRKTIKRKLRFFVVSTWRVK
jgi:hypothetical protein